MLAWICVQISEKAQRPMPNPMYRWKVTLIIKWLLFLAISAHTLYLVAGLFLAYLGANPVEAITHITGSYSLYFLMASLAVTPARKLLKWKSVAKLRRTLGLWSFYYLTLHFLTFVVFDHFFSLSSIINDIVKRPYITVGFLALCILLPLAATSFNGAIKILGKRWQTLHRGIYVAAILAVVHYFWLVKVDYTRPIFFGAIIGFLLVLRSYWWQKKYR